MGATVHNPDQYMFDFRHVITNGRKKIGLLVGAGAPVSINIGTEENYIPLIPDVNGLTGLVKKDLSEDEKDVFEHIESEIPNPNLELVLSRIRMLAAIIGGNTVHGFNSSSFSLLEGRICASITKCVDKDLPDKENAYSDMVSWIRGTNRDHGVEIFTTNYDLLFEEALEKVKAPYFDGFIGAKTAFFDSSSVSSNDFSARWIRLWKLHGSIGWSSTSGGDVCRGKGPGESAMVYPSHLKYDQTQSAPFTSLFDRLKTFLLESDTLLIVSGFSFSDTHISSKIRECMLANPSSAVLAFQYNELEKEEKAVGYGLESPNMSVYCKDGAVINGIKAEWKIGRELPSKNWELIRGEYWDNNKFVLGDFGKLARFLAKAGGDKALSPEVIDSGGDESE